MSKVENLTKNGNPKLFDRKEIKSSLMQFGYGQQEKGTKNQLKMDLQSEYSDEIFDIFMEATDTVIPGFSYIMQKINGLWNREWLSVSWTMPDGVVVTCKPTSSEWVEYKLFDRYPITAKVSGVSKEEQALILYVTIIHSCDAYVARQTIEKSERDNYDLITIHDGYRTLPNHAFKTRQSYNEALAAINDSNLLTDILGQILGRELDPIVGDLDSADILQAKYSLS